MQSVAIITGDIVNSRKDRAASWQTTLKPLFNGFGKSPEAWDIYRGDEFQLRVSPQEALKTAIRIKALVKQNKHLDVRLGIGLGEESLRTKRIGESNGPAYLRSGTLFESLKEMAYSLQINSGSNAYDRALNLMLALALDFMDSWSSVSAEVMALVLKEPEASQQQLAQQLGIRQSAVSQRLKRARYDLVLELLNYYSQTFKAKTHAAIH